MKLKLWMVDLAGGLIMAAIILAAYVFDGPRDQSNSIKPVTTRTLDDMRLLCADGESPIDWICPSGTRP